MFDYLRTKKQYFITGDSQTGSFIINSASGVEQV